MTQLAEAFDEEFRVSINWQVTSISFSRGASPIKVRSGIEPPDIIDTTGAGDAYASGFLYGVLRNRSLIDSALMGRLVAEKSLRVMGARSGLPTSQELTQLVENSDVEPVETAYGTVIGI
jgi:sugar/nucleoside kinase (ribokinase family)